MILWDFWKKRRALQESMARDIYRALHGSRGYHSFSGGGGAVFYVNGPYTSTYAHTGSIGYVVSSARVGGGSGGGGYYSGGSGGNGGSVQS